MAERNLHLVAYDVTDDPRRTSVFKILKGFGQWVQYSLFVCELTERERVRLEGRLLDTIHHDLDKVLIADLGPVSGRATGAIKTLGQALDLDERGPLVV